MARVELTAGSEEWQLFKDYWNLFKDVWGLEDTDEYYQDVADKGEEFAQKYGPFGKELALALVHEIERRSKENVFNDKS